MSLQTQATKTSPTFREPTQAVLSLYERLRHAEQAYQALYEAMWRSDDGPKPHPTLTQLCVLKAAALNHGASQTVLTEATRVDRSTLATTIRLLVKRKWLARQRTKADARAYAVVLTDAGRAAMKAGRAIAQRLDQRMLRGEDVDIASALERLARR